MKFFKDNEFVQGDTIYDNIFEEEYTNEDETQDQNPNFAQFLI
jgi:hypothetical protein